MTATIITSDDLREFKMELLEDIKTLMTEHQPQTKKMVTLIGSP